MTAGIGANLAPGITGGTPAQTENEGGYEMSRTSGKADNSRREFLKLASVSAPAAVAAAAFGGTEAAADTAAEGTVLQDTAHTRAFYESARF